MQKTLHVLALLAMCFLAGACFGQSAAKNPKATSLCSLQKKVADGNHETVLVSGVFSEGLEVGTLEDAACPKEATWVELSLQSEQNKEKLRRLLERSRRAYVVVEGEFYGPPLPDPKLPETIRKDYHPGWGHLAAFKTKLVVHAIRDVKPVPPDQANGGGWRTLNVVRLRGGLPFAVFAKGGYLCTSALLFFNAARGPGG